MIVGVCFRLLYLIMVCLFRWLAVLACSKSAVATELLVLWHESRYCVTKLADHAPGGRIARLSPRWPCRCQKSVTCPALDIHGSDVDQP
jgi:hypothetical protein